MAKRKTGMLVESLTFSHVNAVPDTIEIRNNVPLPVPNHLVMNKYGFISTLQVGESFEISKHTHNFKPKSLAPAAYQVASSVRKNTNRLFTIACRTLEGTSTDPTRVGCWRIS